MGVHLGWGVPVSLNQDMKKTSKKYVKLEIKAGGIGILLQYSLSARIHALYEFIEYILQLCALDSWGEI